MRRSRKRINRAYKREVRKLITLSIIATVALIFAINLGTKPTKKREIGEIINDTTTYVVSEGDCIETIAEKYQGGRKLSNVVTEIQYLNGVNEIIYPGQELVVPIQGEE